MAEEGRDPGTPEKEEEVEWEMELDTPSVSKQELLPLQEVSSSQQPAESQETTAPAEKSSLRQKTSDLVSLIRGLNWTSLAIVTCLCLAYLFCNASYAIMSPFFPKEASCSSIIETNL